MGQHNRNWNSCWSLINSDLVQSTWFKRFPSNSIAIPPANNLMMIKAWHILLYKALHRAFKRLWQHFCRQIGKFSVVIGIRIGIGIHIDIGIGIGLIVRYRNWNRKVVL